MACPSGTTLSRVSRAARRSAVLGLVVDLHLQSEAFETHQHAAQLVPGVTLAVDDEPRNAAVLLVVPRDLATDDPAFGRPRDLRAVRGLLDVRPSERAPHAFEDPLEDRDRVVTRVAQHLELPAACGLIRDLERLDGNMVTAVARAEVELVRCAGGVLEREGCEVRMLELDADPLGHQRVEAARADPARLLRGDGQVDRVIGGHLVPAILAALGAYAHGVRPDQGGGPSSIGSPARAFST